MRDETIKYLDKEMSHGRCSARMSPEEVERALGSPFQASPFGMVERLGKEPRFVRNFSFPYESSGLEYPSVNDRLASDDKLPPTLWCGPKEFAAVVAALPEGVVGRTDDAKSAFRQVPVRKEDRMWTVMEFEGGFYVDFCLPMGLSSSTDIWGRHVDVLRAGADVILREQFSERGAQFLGLHNWVDDLLQLAVLNGLDPTAATTICQDYYADAGVVLADEKGQDWSSVVLFQGLEWDLRLKIVSLPESKRLRALDKLSAFRSSPWVTKDAIESICGYLSHISFVVEEGRFHLVSLFKEKARFMKNPFLKLPLPTDVLADVDWWTARLEAGAPSVDSDSPSMSRRLTVPPALYPSIISSDASDIGIGIVSKADKHFGHSSLTGVETAPTSTYPKPLPWSLPSEPSSVSVQTPPASSYARRPTIRPSGRPGSLGARVRLASTRSSSKFTSSPQFTTASSTYSGFRRS